MWVRLVSNKPTVPDSQQLLSWFPRNDTMYKLVSTFSNECRLQGFEPSLANMAARNLPIPVPLFRLARYVRSVDFLCHRGKSHARTISRKRFRLLIALQEFVEVAHGTCALVHINDHRPDQSFVRIQRPQEQYFAMVQEFDETAEIVQRLSTIYPIGSCASELVSLCVKSFVDYPTGLFPQAGPRALSNGVILP
ncbi:Aste57867_10262 [Aphanomyces stellatus]|uniref:Aste57867_10262 protein n=1 Tax=Aphanomyces stellatus TaxID=120398 RepID=A0A485KQJ7_9STRA|nr:hypothetical protein As57867_010222 [Aphanomyces stellatus]VFT87137.1 Aste57867_10262 [Aphanomyces stellatus]